MASLPIIDRYKAYKAGTDYLVQWLTQSASKCNNATSFFDNLKRKAAARGAIGFEQGAISLTSQDLVRLAELVASDATAHIPSSVLKVTRAVIAGREFCTNWYDVNQKTQSTSDSEGHVYFAQILKKVHDVLLSAQQARGSPPTPSASISGHEDQTGKHQLEQDNFENLFQCLQVEEPSENPLGTTTYTVEGPTRLEKLVFKLEKQLGEKAFAIWCLLEDFCAIKKFVCRVWTEYVAGKKSLRVVGAITNSAFGLMRRANEEFATAHGDVATYWDMFGLLCLEDPTKIGQIDWSSLAGTDDNSILSSFRVDERLCPNAMALFVILRFNFNEIAKDKRSKKGGQVMDRSHAPPYSIGNFGERLLDLAPAIYYEGCASAEFSREMGQAAGSITMDEFCSGIMTYAISNDLEQLPIWLVAASQTYIEIYDIIGSETSCALDGFHVYLEQQQQSVKESKQFWSPVLATLRRKNAPWLEYFDFILDPECRYIWEVAEAMSKYKNAPEHERWKFPVEKMAGVLGHMLPVFPAAVLYYNQNKMQDIGLYMINYSGKVLLLAHLYKAGRHYDLLPSTWEDMDFLLANNDAEGEKRGTRQSIVTKVNAKADVYAMARHFRMALGLPVALQQRSVLPKLPSDLRTDIMLGSRTIVQKSELVNAMKKTTDSVNHLGISAYDSIDVVLRTLTTKASKSGTGGRLHKKKSALTPIELLEALEKHTVQDEPTINFNYIGFLEVCAGIYQNLENNHHNGVKKVPTSKATPHFVDTLLWEAGDAVKRCPSQAPDAIKAALAKTRFGRVMEDLSDEYEAAGRNKFSKAAFEKSSGHLPKHLWPDVGPRT